MYKIQIMLLISATPYSTLGEKDVYQWIDLPLVDGKEYFDTYEKANEHVEDLERSNHINEYKVVMV